MTSHEHSLPVPVEPPGSFIAEELQARGWTVDDLSDRTGLPWEVWARHVLNEKPVPIGAVLSRRLANAFGTSPEFWANLQAQYDTGGEGW